MNVIKSKNVRAFSLIEIMIVIAIIGILGAIAIPQYNAYVIRTTIAQGIKLMDNKRIEIDRYYLKNYALPDTASIAEDNISANGITKITWQKDSATKGYIITIFDNTKSEIQNKEVWLQAEVDTNNELFWSCINSATSPVEAQYLPKSCL